jgi:TolB protein
MITNQGQGDRIGLLDVRTGVIQQLTKSDFDESPSSALNGEMVLYATKSGGSGVLSVVSDLGRVAQTLRVERGDVREPAWSPVYRKL